MILTVGALTLALVAPVAQADDLTDRRHELAQQIAKTKGDLNESSKALTAAGVAVDRAEDKLGQAQADLARTREQLAAAKAEDERLAAKLKKAKKELARAKAAVAAGQAKLDAQQVLVGQMVRDQYQQQTNLLPVAVLLRSTSMADMQTRIQWSTTMFDTTQAKIDRLHVLQDELKAAKAHQADVTAEVADDRAAAAEQLVAKKALEAQAEQQEAAVTALLHHRQAIEEDASADVAADKKQYQQLTQERATVEKRIAIRIAKAKAKAAREAAARKKAAAEAARKARTAKARAKARALARAANQGSGSSGGGSSHHGFIFPVSAAITSPYGMRFHPVLHYWKLHDGTDFGAGCGTAIHAAYDGKVVEKYYNVGYGNRLMIDHGTVDGKFVTTGYNHATSYTVGVGDRVKQGDVIGYVGTTGFSTGCHLHLMVWLDGKMVNPMTWF